MVGWPPNTGWLLNIGYTDFVLFWRKNFEEKWRYSAGINVCVVHMVCLMVTYLTYWSIYTKPYHNEIQSTSCHGKELWLPCFENLKKPVNEVFPVLIRACCLENISTTPWLCALLLLVVSILLLLDFDAITFCNIGGGTKQAAPEGTVIGACLAYSGNITIVKCLDTKKAIFGRTFCISTAKNSYSSHMAAVYVAKKQGIFSISKAHDWSKENKNWW